MAVGRESGNIAYPERYGDSLLDLFFDRIGIVTGTLVKKFMDLNSLLSVLGAMGGFKAVEWLVTFWSTRKVNERKEDAAVDGIENENERKQVAWLEERIS